MKKITAFGVLALFLVSTLYLPLALAEESLVGVVFREWTQQECDSAFGRGATTNDVKSIPNMRSEFEQFKGPLVKGNAETSCYCAGETIMDAKKTGCETCSKYGKGVVYYTDANAIDTANAKVLVNGKDVGCRCASKSANDDFLGMENGACKYGNKNDMDTACQKQFGVTGVSVCESPRNANQVVLRTATYQTKPIDCCCESGFKKQEKEDATHPGGFECVKGLTIVGVGSAMCAELGKNAQYGEGLVECAANVVPKIYGGGYDPNTASDAAKQEFEKRFVGRIGGAVKDDGKPLFCCCGPDQVKDANGKCAKELDECGGIVPGSVLYSKLDADTSIQITGSYTYNGKSWDPEKVKLVDKLKEPLGVDIPCYCKKDSIPYTGDSQYLIKCAPAVKEKDVVFLGKTPEQFAKMFEGDKAFVNGWFAYFAENDYNKNFPIFNYIRANPYESKKAVLFKEVYEGPYKGGVVIMESGTLEFHNIDANRWGKFAAESAVVVAETLLGVGALKQVGKYATKTAMTKALKEGVKETVQEAGEKLVKSGVREIGEATIEATAREATETALGGIAEESAEVLGKQTIKNLGGRSLSNAQYEYIARMVAPNNPTVTKGKALIAEFLKGKAGPLDEAGMKNVAAAVGKSTYFESTYETAATTMNKVAVRAALEGVGGVVKESFYFVGDGLRGLGTLISGAFQTRVVKLLGYFGTPLAAAFGDELIPSQTSVWLKKGIVGVSGAISGGLIGAAVGAPAGGIGAVPGFIIGALIGASVNLLADATDKTEMQMKWNGQKQGAEVWNLVVSNSLENCGKLKDNSGIKFMEHKYTGGTIDGWAMTSFAYAAKECPLLKGGGDFMIMEPLPVGQRVSCQGCSPIQLGSKCGEKSTEWAGNQKMVSGTSQVICCQECLRIDDKIDNYYNMPEAANETGAAGSTISIG